MSVTYSSSKFLSSSKLDVSEDRIKTIHDEIHDLEKFNKTKTTAELQRALDQHFHCIEDVSSEEEIDEDTVPVPVTKTTSKDAALDSIFEGVTDAPKSAPVTDDTDAKLKELLAGL